MNGMSLFFGNRLNRILMDTAGDGKGGGGGGGNPSPPPPDTSKDIEALRGENDALKKRLEALEGKNNPPPQDDKDLLEKARMQKEADAKGKTDVASLESSLKFTMGLTDFVKTNESLLPSDFKAIVEAAEKETYDSAIQKASAIKSAIIKGFFEVQENLDLLTPSQKNQLDDYLKLTKTGREEKATGLYDMIFEPAFEMQKRLRKADLLSKGHGDGSNDSYKKRLVERAKKHFLKET